MKKGLLFFAFLIIKSNLFAQSVSMMVSGNKPAIKQYAMQYPGTNLVLDKNDKYLPLKGFLWLATGEYIIGELSFKSHTEEVPTGSTGPGGVAKTRTVYHIDEFLMNGNSYTPEQVAVYGSEGDRYVKDLCEYDKKGKLKKEKDDEMNFEPGFIMLNDSVKEEGFVAIRGCAMFAKTMESKVQISFDLKFDFYQSYKIKHVVQKIDNKETEYMPYMGEYIKVKSNKWDSVVVITNDGKKIGGVGERNGKMIMYSSKGFESLKFKEHGKYANCYFPGDVKGIITVDGKDTKEYIAFDNAFFSKQGLLDNVVKVDNKDKETNFQVGSIELYDGNVLKGKVARQQYNKAGGFYFIDQNNELSSWYGDRNVKCFSQTIDGVEKKFIRIGKVYTEWFYFDQKISYFKNPYPSHLREGLTSWTSAIAREATKKVVEEVTEASIKKNVAKKDLGKAIDNAVLGNDIYNAVDNAETEGGIYFKEYMVLFQDQEPISVYKKNIKSNVNAWLLSCADMTKIDQKAINKMESIDNINETIKILNANTCY